MSSSGVKKPRLDTGEDGSSGAPRSVTVASAGTVELPMLMRTNYHDWSLVMKVSLEALGLWKAVEADKAEHQEDRMALVAILRAVLVDMKASLAVMKTAKEAWAAVKTARVGDAGVKEANVQRLLKEFETVVHADGENIDDLAARINGIAGRLRELGEKMEEKRVVRKILRVVPKRYNQIAVAIEMFGDLDAMTVPGLVGKLRAAEDRYDDDVAAAEAGVERLLLTEEQWEARKRRAGKGRAHGSDGAKGGGHGGDHGDDDDGGSSTNSGREGSRYRGRCFECGVRGHMARDCPKKKKERALLCGVDNDDEPALL